MAKAQAKKKVAPKRKKAAPSRTKVTAKKAVAKKRPVAKKAVAKKTTAKKTVAKKVTKKAVATKSSPKAAKKGSLKKAVVAEPVAEKILTTPVAAPVSKAAPVVAEEKKGFALRGFGRKAEAKVSSKAEAKEVAPKVSDKASAVDAPKKAETPKPKRGKKSGGNPELAEKIRAWAKKRRMPKDPYLMGIADAIENDEDLIVWASTDVLQIFPHAFIKPAETRLYSMLVLTRNILVFVPVALTWLAISKATTAFALYTAKSTGSVANFLQFWEDGYGFLAEEWTISHVALLDFFIIAAVIALTLITPIMAHNAEARAEKEELDAERERIGLAVEVMAFLFDKREVNTVTMNAALARSVSNLRESSRSLNEASKRIEKIAKSLPNNATIIQEIRKIGK